MLNAEPYDVLLFYRMGSKTLIHTAVVAAPGIAFEKTGLNSELFFRFASTRIMKHTWYEAGTILRIRATGAELPEPSTLFNTETGNVRKDGGIHSLLGTLPPLVPDVHFKGRYSLPKEAYTSSTFRFEPFSPLRRN